MFQTHLPSGRRRLFFFLLFIFTIVVFGTRYLLNLFGWVDEQPNDPPQTPTPKPSVEQPEERSVFTREQVEQARGVAETFIRRYTQHDLSQSEAWYQSFVSLLDDKYAKEVQSEAEHSRPTAVVVKTNFLDLIRSECHPQDERVLCHLAVTTETIDAQGASTLIDKNYEVLLSLQNGNWKVEGLNIHGILD